METISVKEAIITVAGVILVLLVLLFLMMD
jgi:hypothetical protein